MTKRYVEDPLNLLATLFFPSTSFMPPAPKDECVCVCVGMFLCASVCVITESKRRREGAEASTSMSSVCDVAREAGGVQVLFFFLRRTLMR